MTRTKTKDSIGPERTPNAPIEGRDTVARRRLEHALVEASQGLTKLARRMLGRASAEDAQDVAQTARERMVRAIRVGQVRPERFTGRGRDETVEREDPWTIDVRRQLFAVLRNLVIDLFRANKRAPAQLAFDEHSSPDRAALSAQDRTMVRQHLDALVRASKISAFDREAYIQSELCERTLDECVEALCQRGFSRVDRTTVRNRALAVRRFLHAYDCEPNAAVVGSYPASTTDTNESQ
jgi:DNA-directed RNA polymerase specialized sigma24 family protein